jgi:hypothetical protein
VGCGEGAWFPLLKELRPKLRYLGLDTSDYAVRRFGRSRNVRPGSWGQLAELRFDEPFDLVVCSDALHYVPTREVVRGLAGLGELVGGVAYFDFGRSFAARVSWSAASASGPRRASRPSSRPSSARPGRNSAR